MYSFASPLLPSLPGNSPLAKARCLPPGKVEPLEAKAGGVMQYTFLQRCQFCFIINNGDCLTSEGEACLLSGLKYTESTRIVQSGS